MSTFREKLEERKHACADRRGFYTQEEATAFVEGAREALRLAAERYGDGNLHGATIKCWTVADELRARAKELE